MPGSDYLSRDDRFNTNRSRKAMVYHLPGFPPILLRESVRAKYVRLRASPENGLEIVVPADFDRRGLADILNKHRGWIEKSIQRARLMSQGRKPAPPRDLPETIELMAIEERWAVIYRSSPLSSITVTEEPNQHLLVRGRVEHQEMVSAALRRWLMKKARAWLSRWALDLAGELGLPCQRVTIRNQHTRLGSCTAERHLSLNAKLLFFPEAAVRYVLVHELCHILHLNHSPNFWREVEKRDPHYCQARAQARAAWKRLPAWAHAPR